jgi:copper chaperone CopZ
MKKLVLTIPILYADHHATAVFEILAKTDGVSDVFVSSAFHQISLKYDPKVVNEDKIKASLGEHGYEANGTELSFPATVASIGDKSTRHTAAFEGVGDALSFTEHSPAWEGKPLWPCPGFGEQATMDD